MSRTLGVHCARGGVRSRASAPSAEEYPEGVRGARPGWICAFLCAQINPPPQPPPHASAGEPGALVYVLLLHPRGTPRSQQMIMICQERRHCEQHHLFVTPPTAVGCFGAGCGTRGTDTTDTTDTPRPLALRGGAISTMGAAAEPSAPPRPARADRCDKQAWRYVCGTRASCPALHRTCKEWGEEGRLIEPATIKVTFF